MKFTFCHCNEELCKIFRKCLERIKLGWILLEVRSKWRHLHFVSMRLQQFCPRGKQTNCFFYLLLSFFLSFFLSLFLLFTFFFLSLFRIFSYLSFFLSFFLSLFTYLFIYFSLFTTILSIFISHSSFVLYILLYNYGDLQL